MREEILTAVDFFLYLLRVQGGCTWGEDTWNYNRQRLIHLLLEQCSTEWSEARPWQGAARRTIVVAGQVPHYLSILDIDAAWLSRQHFLIAINPGEVLWTEFLDDWHIKEIPLYHDATRV